MFAWQRINVRARSGLAMAVSSLFTTAVAAAAPMPATVSVDFAQPQGSLLRTERFNNLHTTSVFAAQRPSDVAYLNAQGLHGTLFRIWLNSPNEANVPPCAEDVGSVPQAGKPCTLNPPFQAYLDDADQAGDQVLGNLRLDGTPGFITAGGPDAAVPLIERLLLAIKQAHPRFTHVEAWNEPDAPGTVITPQQVYPYYVAVYRAVNNLNARLGATVPGYRPMKVGGPALYYFNKAWFATFLDAYAADPDPAKRLDFLSYHGYVDVDAGGAIHPLKSNPSFVQSQRAQLEALLKARGIATDIPSYVTETGIFPGPLCDRCDSTDYLRSAAGVAALHYWFTNEPRTYPFNWLTRQRAGGLKDQFVTKNPVGPYINTSFQQLWQPFDPVPTHILTPFGNMLLMKSKMKDRRVAAHSGTLAYDGIGVYAMASHDATGASMMVWNYQGCPGGVSGNPPSNPNCPTQAYSAALSAENLPASVRDRPVRERVFLIDQATSNYFGDPSRASLQQVGSRLVTTGSSYRNTLELAPNALYLVVLEPTTPPSKDACKDGGWRQYVDDRWQDFGHQGDCVSWAARRR
jgi:hypothetical protein